MDYGRAFFYFFNEKRWVKKFIVGTLFELLVTISLLLLFFISFAIKKESIAILSVVLFIFNLTYGLNIFGGGYMLRLIEEKGDNNLPQWRPWGDLMKKGFSLLSIQLLYSLPAFLLTFVIIAFYPHVDIPLRHAPIDKNSTVTVIPEIHGLPFSVIIGIFVILLAYLILVYFIMPISISVLAKEKSLLKAINIINITKLTFKNFIKIFLTLITIIGLQILVGVLSITIILQWPAMFYGRLVAGKLYSKLADLI